MNERVKNLPTMHNSQEARVQPLGQEGALEDEMVSNYTVFLPKKIPWTEDPGSLQSKESQRGRHNWARMHAYSWNTLETWIIFQEGGNNPKLEEDWNQS